jgi:hypothetical protein
MNDGQKFMLEKFLTKCTGRKRLLRKNRIRIVVLYHAETSNVAASFRFRVNLLFIKILSLDGTTCAVTKRR